MTQTATPGEAWFAYSLANPATNSVPSRQLLARFDEPRAAVPELPTSRVDPASAPQPGSLETAWDAWDEGVAHYRAPPSAPGGCPHSPATSSSESEQAVSHRSHADIDDQTAQSLADSNIEREEETPAELCRRRERERLEELERHLEDDTGPDQRTDRWVAQAIRDHEVQGQQSGRAQRKLFCEVRTLRHTGQDQRAALEGMQVDFGRVLGRLRLVEGLYEQLRRQNADLEQQNAHQQEQIDLLQHQIGQQQRQMGEQQQQLDNVQARVLYLEERDGEHYHRLGQLEGRVAWHRNHMRRLEDRIAWLEGQFA